MTEPHDLRRRVDELDWYHTIELPGGVTTPGWYDLRPSEARIPLPASLVGRRCLDVGSADGYWAFALERRGATEVVSLDLDDLSSSDWPARAPRSGLDHGLGRARRAFELAKESIGSRVERRDGSVYELDPEQVGTFDVVFLGSLLLHLRDPVRALEAIRTVCRGELWVHETVSLRLALLAFPWPAATLQGKDEVRWWTANPAGLRRMLEGAGFEVADAERGFHHVPFGEGFPRLKGLPLDPTKLAFRLGRQPYGAPHAWARAVPLP